MKFSITIPNWSEGKPLTISNIDAENAAAACVAVIAWVNRRAGYDYCQQLPPGTTVREC